jgi:3-phosphoshikimate 1-carboxyvinyltransferase
MQITLSKSKLTGELILPGSKSQTLRALFFASLSTTPSTIDLPLLSDDSDSMINAMESFGANFVFERRLCHITPAPWPLKTPDQAIDVKNSGIVFRFLTALAALTPGKTTITGSEQLTNQRPIVSLTDALSQLGVFVESHNQSIPLKIKGPITKNKVIIHTADSQPLSALIYLSIFTNDPIEIFASGLKEAPWIDLTLSWLDFLKIPYERQGYSHFIIKNQKTFEGFYYKVPGDLSAMAFWVVLSIIQQTSIVVHRVDLDDPQGDKILIDLIDSLRVDFTYSKENQSLHLHPKEMPNGFSFDLENGIDLLPALAVLACFLKTPTHLYNGSIARTKESNRIECMALELKKMGASLVVQEDGLKIFPSPLKGAHVSSHQDHRVAMALSICAISIDGESVIDGYECVSKTYPEFFAVLDSLKPCVVL